MISGSDTEAGNKVPAHGENGGFPLKGCGEGPIEGDKWGAADEDAAYIVDLFPPE